MTEHRSVLPVRVGTFLYQHRWGAKSDLIRVDDVEDIELKKDWHRGRLPVAEGIGCGSQSQHLQEVEVSESVICQYGYMVVNDIISVKSSEKII